MRDSKNICVSKSSTRRNVLIFKCVSVKERERDNESERDDERGQRKRERQ